MGSFKPLEEFLRSSMEKNGGMLAHTPHLSDQEAIAGRLTGVHGQPGLETLFPKAKPKQYSKLLKECTYKRLVRIF